MFQEILHKFVLSSILSELLSKNCWLSSVQNDIVHCFRSEQCLNWQLFPSANTSTCGPSHLEQNLSRAGNSITVPHTHENFCTPLQSTIQWFLDVSQKKKKKIILKALEEHECGGPTCHCVEQTSLKIPIILLKLNCGPPSKQINKSEYA